MTIRVAPGSYPSREAAASSSGRSLRNARAISSDGELASVGAPRSEDVAGGK